MNNVLFMLGNGFDLNCGMKTRYTDFYSEYIKNTTNDSELIKRFKNSIADDYQTWANFEIAMGKFAGKLNSADEFVDCIIDFETGLSEYVKKEEEQFLSKLIGHENVVYKEIISSLKNFCKGLSPNIDRLFSQGWNQYTFISFNYTTVADELFKKALGNNTLDVHHVHGRTEDLTLGCNDVGQIHADYANNLDLQRIFIKPEHNKYYDSDRILKANNLINSTNVICTYGWSMADSDAFWRDMLLKWLQGDANNHLFMYVYDESGANGALSAKRIRGESKKKEELLETWNIELGDTEKDKLHIVWDKNIFNVNQVIEKEISSQGT